MKTLERTVKWIRTIRSITKPLRWGSEEIELEEMECINVSESIKMYKFNESFALEFNQLVHIKVFADMLRSTEEFDQPEIEVPPDFDLEIRYKGDVKERYQLWLGRFGKPSVLKDASQTHLVYKVPADVTDRLIHTLNLED